MTAQVAEGWHMAAPDRPVWALVPVKPFATAKRRLSPVLDAVERARLARAMLEDVLAALRASADLLAGLIVVTADAEARALAERHGALVLCDTESAGINAALALAVRHLNGTPGAAVLVVPSDVPLLSRDTIANAVAALDADAAVVAVAAPDRGTNLLGCRPADIIPFGFGPRSFDRHGRAARRAGVWPRVPVCPDVARDIDRPDDLAVVLARGARTRTHALLAEFNMANRLDAWRRDRELARLHLGTTNAHELRQ